MVLKENYLVSMLIIKLNYNITILYPKYQKNCINKSKKLF